MRNTIAFGRLSPLWFLVLLTMMAYITSQAPPQFVVFIRALNGYIIIGMLLWAFQRYGDEARLARKELRDHRNELLQAIHYRSTEFQQLKQQTARLEETARRLAMTRREEAQVLKETAKVTTEHLENISRRLDEHGVPPAREPEC
jgi:hypothetical protein